MIKKTTYAIAALIILFAAGTGIAGADSNWKGMVKWQTYAQVQPEKNNSDRKIFIYISSKRCGYCRKLEKEAFTNQTIVDYLNDNYTFIHVDSDKESQLARRLGVRGVPDLRFLTPQNEPIARLPGYVPPETLLNLLQFVQTDSYKTMALNDFVEKQKRN